MVAFLVTLLIAVVLNVAAYLLAPKPKVSKPEAAKQMDDPVAEAGIEVSVIFGTITKKDPNILWYGDKTQSSYKLKV